MTEFYSFGIPSKTIALEAEAFETEYDLIMFLATAQASNIDFLPIPWNPALEGLGTGRTGDVRETYINLRASLAFKRVAIPWLRQSSESDVFMALLSEIYILGQPLIRQHPNIVTLEGLCWDFADQPAKAWPVLIFEKTELGNIEKFARSRNILSWSQRIDLCADIGSAVDLMHSQHVIHGDIKPSNVLIFPNGASGVVAKLTDFGFSACFSSGHSIYMPRTRPWNAPEWHHHRKYTFDEAMLMDVYSYGMLCMWILFYMSGNNATIEMLSVLDQYESLSARELAFKLVDQVSLANKDEERRVSEFFAHSLADDPKARQSSVGSLVAQLRSSRPAYPSTDSKAPNTIITQRHRYSEFTCRKFELSRAVFQLYAGDFRVRSYIFQCLEKRVPELQSTDEHLLIQLALCYTIGFGTQKDDVKAAKILEGASSTALTQELGRRIAEIRVDDRPVYTIPGKIRELLFEGHIRRPLFTEVYQDYSVTKSFESTCIREIEDLTSVLGVNHILPHSLNDDLGCHYVELGLFIKALPLNEQVYEREKAKFGIDHKCTQSSLVNIANTLICLGKYETAIKLHSEVMHWRLENLGEEHPMSLASMSSLATAYGSLGIWDKAEELYLRVQHVQDQSLGPKHRHTLKTKSLHIDMKLTRGQYDDAQKLLDVLLKNMTQSLGADDPLTLSSLHQLMTLHQQQGRYSEGEKQARCALERMTKALGDQHSETIKCLSQLAIFKARQGHFQEAEELASSALKAADAAFGEEHSGALAAAHVWIGVCQENGQVDIVQQFAPKLITRIAAAYGEDHLSTLCASQNLAVSYLSSNHWVEAESILKEVTEKMRNAYGRDLPVLQGAKSNLANLYNRQGRWSDAESLCRDALESWKRIGVENTETWACEDLLLTVLLHQERWSNASELGENVVIRAKEIFDEMHPLYLRSMERLAEAYKFCRRFEDAFRLESQVVETRQLCSGNKDSTTLTSMHNLATTKYLIGQEPAALELMGEVLSLSKEALGAQHPITLESAECVEGWAARDKVTSRQS